MKILILAAVVLLLPPGGFSTVVPRVVTQNLHKNNDQPNDAPDQVYFKVYSNKNSTELVEPNPGNMHELSQNSEKSNGVGVRNRFHYVPRVATQNLTAHKNNDQPADAQDQVYSNNSTEPDEPNPRNMYGLSQNYKKSNDAGVGNKFHYVRLYYFIMLRPNVSGNASKGQNIYYNNKHTHGNILNKDDLNRHKGLVEGGGFDKTKVLNNKVNSAGPNIMLILPVEDKLRFKDDSDVKEDALRPEWKKKYLERIESHRKLPDVLTYNRNYVETSKLKDKAFELSEEKSFVSKPKAENNEEKASYANLHENLFNGNKSKVDNDVKTLLQMIVLLNKMKYSLDLSKEKLENLQRQEKDHKSTQPIINQHNATYYKYLVEPAGQYADGTKTKNTHDLGYERKGKRNKRNVWFRRNDRSGIHSEIKWSDENAIKREHLPASSTKHKRQIHTHMEAKGKDHDSSNLKHETRADTPLTTSFKGAVTEKPSINSTVRKQISAKDVLDNNSKGDETLIELSNSDPKRNSTLVEMTIKNPTKEGSALEKTIHKNLTKEGSSHEKSSNGSVENSTPVEIQTNKNPEKEGSSHEKTSNGSEGNGTPVEIRTHKNPTKGVSSHEKMSDGSRGNGTPVDIRTYKIPTKEESSHEKTSDGPKGNGTPAEIQTNKNPTKEESSHAKTSDGPKGNGTPIEIQTNKNLTKEGSSHEKVSDGPKGNDTPAEIQTNKNPTKEESSHEKTSDGPKGNGTSIEIQTNKNPTKEGSLQEKITKNDKENITSSENPNISDELKSEKSHLVKNATAGAKQFHIPVKHKDNNSTGDVKDKNAPLNSHLNNSNSSSSTQMINLTNTMGVKMVHRKQNENTTEGIQTFESFPRNTSTGTQIVRGNTDNQSIIEGKSTEVMTPEAANNVRVTQNHQTTKPIQAVHNGSLNKTSHANNTLSNHTNDNLSSEHKIFRRHILFTNVKLDDKVPSGEMETIIPDETNHNNRSIVKIGKGIDQVNKNQKFNVTGADGTHTDNAGKTSETEIVNRSTINNNEEITSLDDLQYDAKTIFQVQLYNLMANFMKTNDKVKENYSEVRYKNGEVPYNVNDNFNKTKIANQTHLNENNGRNTSDDNVRDATNMKTQSPLHQMMTEENPKFNDSMGDQIQTIKIRSNSDFKKTDNSSFNDNAEGIFTLSNSNGTLKQGTLNETTEQSQMYEDITTDGPTETDSEPMNDTNESPDNQQNFKNHRLKRQILFMPKHIPDTIGSSIAETKVTNLGILNDGKNSKENTMATKQTQTLNETLLDGTVKANHTRQKNNADLPLSAEEKNNATHLKGITSMATNTTEQSDFIIKQLHTENNTKEMGSIQDYAEKKALVPGNSANTSNPKLDLDPRKATYDANHTVLESTLHVITDKNPLAFSHGKHSTTDAAIKQNSHERMTEPNEKLTSEAIIRPLVSNTHSKPNKRVKRFRKTVLERNM